MSFKKISVLVFCILVMGCGRFGEEPPQDKTLNLTYHVACLKNIGPEFYAYTVGEITPEAWGKVWDCTANSLRIFNRIMKPEDPSGFSVAEMQALLNGSFLEKQNVSEDFVSSAMVLKASLLGGLRSFIAKQELETDVIPLLYTFQAVSVSLIPHMKAKANNPNVNQLLALARAVKEAGNQMAESFKTEGKEPLTRNDVEVMIDELKNNLGFELPNFVVPAMFKIKWLLYKGSPTEIEPQQWPKLIRTGSKFMGILWALLLAKKEQLKDPAMIKMATDLKEILLDSSIKIHHGKLNLKAMFKELYPHFSGFEQVVEDTGMLE